MSRNRVALSGESTESSGPQRPLHLPVRLPEAASVSRSRPTMCTDVALGHAAREALLQIVRHGQGGLRGDRLQIGQPLLVLRTQAQDKGSTNAGFVSIEKARTSLRGRLLSKTCSSTLTTEISEASTVLTDARTTPAQRNKTRLQRRNGSSEKLQRS